MNTKRTTIPLCGIELARRASQASVSTDAEKNTITPGGTMGIRRKSYVRLYYHFVWGTKNREPVINREIENLIRESFASKSDDLNIKILEHDGVDDHVHVLVSSLATLAPADIAKHLKGASSHHINDSLAESSFRWQDGYGVVSVSPKDIIAVRKYIRNQKEHHRKGTLDERLEYDSADDSLATSDNPSL